MSSLFNLGSQGLTNQANRRFTEKMNQWQNNTYLTNWGLENEYNSPVNQMKRLKDAGINPHLAYQGGGFNNSAGSIGVASPSGGQAKAPEIDPSFVTSIFLNFIDLEKKRADIDLLKEQVKNMTVDTSLKSVQKDTADFNLGKSKQLLPYQLTAADLANRKTEADTAYTVSQNARADIMQNATLKKMAEEVANLRATRKLTGVQVNEVAQRIRNMILDGKLKALELKYGFKGILDGVLSGDSFVKDLPTVPKMDKPGNSLDKLGRGLRGLRRR